MFMFFMCPHPGCGQIFHPGEQVPDTCPNCGENPHAKVDANGQPFVYSREELKGKRLIEAKG